MRRTWIPEDACCHEGVGVGAARYAACAAACAAFGLALSVVWQALLDAIALLAAAWRV